jgi:hypothetical protein
MAVPFESVPHNFLPPLAPVLPLKRSREKPQTTSKVTFATQGNQGSRQSTRANNHYTPEKLRMECVGKTCRAATRVAACRYRL